MKNSFINNFDSNIIKKLDNPSVFASILIIFSCIVAGIVILTDRRDITSATMVLASATCFIIGILIFIFYKEEKFNPTIAGLLPVYGSINLSRICADVGINGDAHFIPVSDKFSKEYSHKVMQFNPLSMYESFEFTDDVPFYTKDGKCGLATIPSGISLLDMLIKDYSLQISSDEVDLFAAIEEIIQEVIMVSNDVTITKSGNAVVINFKNYQLFDGHMIEYKESPKCCTMMPSAIFSLMACMLAYGLKKTCKISKIESDIQQKSVMVVIEIFEDTQNL